MTNRSKVAFAALFLALGVWGCKPSTPKGVKELSVAEAATAKEQGAVFMDANSAGFRKENGVVPDAVLLANYREYDVKSVLPENKDTPLVFYCSSRL